MPAGRAGVNNLDRRAFTPEPARHSNERGVASFETDMIKELPNHLGLTIAACSRLGQTPWLWWPTEFLPCQRFGIAHALAFTGQLIQATAEKGVGDTSASVVRIIISRFLVFTCLAVAAGARFGVTKRWATGTKTSIARLASHISCICYSSTLAPASFVCTPTRIKTHIKTRLHSPDPRDERL